MSLVHLLHFTEKKIEARKCKKKNNNNNNAGPSRSEVATYSLRMVSASGWLTFTCLVLSPSVGPGTHGALAICLVWHGVESLWSLWWVAVPSKHAC